MPELPEVETVRRGLAPVMEGSMITDAVINRPNLRFPFPDKFVERLEGRKITSVGRRAKYLVVDLDSDDVLVMHLGMSGSFRVELEKGHTLPGVFYHPRCDARKHDHVIFGLDTKHGAAQVIYNDPRRFGYMDLSQQAMRLMVSYWLLYSKLNPLLLKPHFLTSALSQDLAIYMSARHFGVQDFHPNARLLRLPKKGAKQRSALNCWQRASEK